MFKKQHRDINLCTKHFAQTYLFIIQIITQTVNYTIKKYYLATWRANFIPTNVLI